MKRFWARFYLWWNDYCTKHYTKKEYCCMSGCSWCEQCDEEDKAHLKCNLLSAMDTLRK